MRMISNTQIIILNDKIKPIINSDYNKVVSINIEYQPFEYLQKGISFNRLSLVVPKISITIDLRALKKYEFLYDKVGRQFFIIYRVFRGRSAVLNAYYSAELTGYYTRTPYDVLTTLEFEGDTNISKIDLIPLLHFLNKKKKNGTNRKMSKVR